MILPTTYTAELLLLVFSLLCLGSWANTQKLSGKWRFEFFYYDFTAGVIVCALIAAFTFGSLNSQELTFQDSLLIASKRAMAYIFGAGMLFNLANMLLLGAMQVSGMSVAFPIAFGVALVIGAISSYVGNPMINAALIFSGAILTLIAIVTVAFAHVAHQDAQPQAMTPLRPESRVRADQRSPLGLGIALSIVSGILLSLYAPVSETARAGETGVSSYSAAVLFGCGILLSTFLYSPFFLNFPVQGRPAQFWDYVKGTKQQHWLGLLGGIVWMAGMLAAFTAASGPPAPLPAVNFAILQGVPLAAALWGLLAWQEFGGATIRVKMLLLTMLVLYTIGIGVIAIAPIYSASK